MFGPSHEQSAEVPRARARVAALFPQLGILRARRRAWETGNARA